MGNIVRLAADNGIWLRVQVAANFWSRAIGLLFTGKLGEDQGLWIRPCSDVHTWFMRYSIDVVFLGKDNRVLAISENVAPFRFVFGPKGSQTVLELASGAAMLSGIKVGDMLNFV